MVNNPTIWYGFSPTRRCGQMLGGLTDVRLDLLQHALLGHVADESLRLPAVLEQDHRRDRADAEPSSGDRIGVDVKLGDLDLLALLVRDLLKDRRDHPAGSAPRRPEVDEHRCLRLQDILLEVCVTRLLRLSHLYRSLRQGHLGGTHHHLNANCCPICSTSGERPKTGSSKSSARSGRAVQRRSGAHFTKRQPRRRTRSAIAGDRRSLNSASERRSSAIATKRKIRSSSGIASPSATMLRWSRAVHSSCQRNTIRPRSYQTTSTYSSASEAACDTRETGIARSASVWRSPKTLPRSQNESGNARRSRSRPMWALKPSRCPASRSCAARSV